MKLTQKAAAILQHTKKRYMIKKSKCSNAVREEHCKKGKKAYSVLSEDFTVLIFYIAVR